jgi:hypothetical protein
VARNLFRPVEWHSGQNHPQIYASRLVPINALSRFNSRMSGKPEVTLTRRERPYSRNKVVQTVLQQWLTGSGFHERGGALGFMVSATRSRACSYADRRDHRPTAASPRRPSNNARYLWARSRLRPPQREREPDAPGWTTSRYHAKCVCRRRNAVGEHPS